MTYEPGKLGHADLVFFDQSSSVGLCTQDHESATFSGYDCDTMVNTQTHTH